MEQRSRMTICGADEVTAGLLTGVLADLSMMRATSYEPRDSSNLFFLPEDAFASKRFRLALVAVRYSLFGSRFLCRAFQRLSLGFDYCRESKH